MKITTKHYSATDTDPDTSACALAHTFMHAMPRRTHTHVWIATHRTVKRIFELHFSRNFCRYAVLNMSPTISKISSPTSDTSTTCFFF